LIRDFVNSGAGLRIHYGHKSSSYDGLTPGCNYRLRNDGSPSLKVRLSSFQEQSGSSGDALADQPDSPATRRAIAESISRNFRTANGKTAGYNKPD
jgi:hypothetical protein